MTISLSHNRWLLLGGIGSTVIALLHVAIILIGIPAYIYFGAASMVPLLKQGSYLPAIITGVFSFIFALWALYAFSGAKLIPRLPLLRPVLLLVGTVYTLRGLMFFLDLFYLLSGRHPALHFVAFSLGSLVFGICYILGGVQMLKINPSAPLT